MHTSTWECWVNPPNNTWTHNLPNILCSGYWQFTSIGCNGNLCFPTALHHGHSGRGILRLQNMTIVYLLPYCILHYSSLITCCRWPFWSPQLCLVSSIHPILPSIFQRPTCMFLHLDLIYLEKCTRTLSYGLISVTPLLVGLLCILNYPTIFYTNHRMILQNTLTYLANVILRIHSLITVVNNEELAIIIIVTI